MGHLVRYRSPEGEERYDDVDDLDAAVQRVEQLHNEDGISNVRVYREVPLEFRTYVRVAVADEDTPARGSTSPEPPSGSSASPPSGSSASPPSGAAVISPAPSSNDPAETPAEPSAQAIDADAEVRTADNRRVSLFNRGQSS